MKLLLDTHAFIWWNSNSSRLSARVFAACQNQANTMILSVASAWEMQIKMQLGKLTLDAPLAEIIENQQKVNRLEVLPVILPHVMALDNLPLHHKDPFDRLLVAQANVEEAVLVSHDPLLADYSVQIFW